MCASLLLTAARCCLQACVWGAGRGGYKGGRPRCSCCWCWAIDDEGGPFQSINPGRARPPITHDDPTHLTRVPAAPAPVAHAPCCSACGVGGGWMVGGRSMRRTLLMDDARLRQAVGMSNRPQLLDFISRSTHSGVEIVHAISSLGHACSTPTPTPPSACPIHRLAAQDDEKRRVSLFRPVGGCEI